MEVPQNQVLNGIHTSMDIDDIRVIDDFEEPDEDTYVSARAVKVACGCGEEQMVTVGEPTDCPSCGAEILLYEQDV